MGDVSDANKMNIICENCKHFMEVDGGGFNDNNKSIDKCRKWLKSCSLSDDDDGNSDVATSVTDSSNFDSALVFKDDGVHVEDLILAENNNQHLDLSTIINKVPNNYGDIQIYKSKKVHIGDITHINGNVYVNQYIPTVNQKIVINTTTYNTNPRVFIVARRTWLAQPPVSREDVHFFTSPAKCVIISHSASEDAYTQTENNLNVRLIQQFHIESRKWNDISYNFLIGAEGSVFEGRGWDVIGAHTFHYNHFSIGICFIGCYVTQRPPAVALQKARDLILEGVAIGKIHPDYTLLAHCQCSSTASPGKMLFEEIKTWDQWDERVTLENPSPLVDSCDK